MRATPVTSSRTGKVFALSLGKGLTTVVALVSGMVMARILNDGYGPCCHYQKYGMSTASAASSA